MEIIRIQGRSRNLEMVSENFAAIRQNQKHILIKAKWNVIRFVQLCNKIRLKNAKGVDTLQFAKKDDLAN